MKKEKFFRRDTRVGDCVELVCCKERCSGQVKGAVLHRGFVVNPDFSARRQAGKIRWPRGSMLMGFILKDSRVCPKCKTVFSDAVVVVSENRPDCIFGYSSMLA